MAVDGIDSRCRGKRKEREELVSKHQIQPGFGESTDSPGTEGRSASCESSFSGATRDRGEILFFPFS